MRSEPKIWELKVTPNIPSLADSHFQLPDAPGTLKPIVNVSSTNIPQTPVQQGIRRNSDAALPYRNLQSEPTKMYAQEEGIK